MISKVLYPRHSMEAEGITLELNFKLMNGDTKGLIEEDDPMDLNKAFVLKVGGPSKAKWKDLKRPLGEIGEPKTKI